MWKQITEEQFIELHSLGLCVSHDFKCGEAGIFERPPRLAIFLESQAACYDEYLRRKLEPDYYKLRFYVKVEDEGGRGSLER